MAKICPICESTFPDENAFCPNDGATLRAEESSEDLVGAVIADRYKISKLLGEGGMGRVYLARHVRLPQQAAIKVLHPGMVSEAGAVARFNREAANAAQIEHDRVARVFDFGETSDGLVYLAMEYVPGTTLRSLLMEQGRLTPARAANITYQVAEGLDAAHRIGIIHRDLKPDNILVVTDENGVDRCKVVDFGIAKAMDAKQTQLTQTGMLVGTPEFMSPEQVLGETLDARSDVYALALVSYQLFTGMLPFGGTTPERSLAARLMEDPKSLSETVPDIAWPEALQQAFDRALSREPDTRTAWALDFGEAVVAAVESWLGSAVLRGRTPMSTASITLAAGMATPASVTPLQTGAIPANAARTANVASSATSAAGASPTGTSAQAPPVTAQDSAIAKKSNRVPMIIGGSLVVLAASAAFFVLKDRGSAPGGDNAPSVVADGAAGNGSNSGAPPSNTQAPGSSPAARPAAPVNSPSNAAPNATNAAPNTPTTPGTASVSAANNDTYDPSADLAILENLRKDLDSEDPAVWRRTLTGALGILTRMRTPTDSLAAEQVIVEAHGLMIGSDDLSQLNRACEHYRRAMNLARRLRQESALQVYSTIFVGCASRSS